MNRIKVVVFTGFLLSLLAACPSDNEAPAKPELDAIATVTSLGLVRISGRAEYLARVEIKDSAETIYANADAQTGRFSTELALAMGDNSIEVVAIDASGLRSEAATASIVREAARAESIRISLEHSIIDADQGELAVQVEVFNDESEISLAELGVSLSIAHYPLEISPVNVVLDNEGRGRAIVGGLFALGSGELVASAEIAGADGSRAETSAGFAVLAGAVTDIELMLSANLDSGLVGPATEISVPADSEVQCHVTVSDEHGNSIENAPVALGVQRGEADIVGTVIQNLRRAGSYRVVASEGLLASQATINVLPGAGSRIELTLSATQIRAGDDVVATALVYDIFDNLVVGASPSIQHNVPAIDLLGDPQVLVTGVTEGGIEATMQIRSAGLFDFSASFNSLVEQHAALRVMPASPANGVIDFAPNPLVAGEILAVTPSFTDAYANPVDAEFSLACDAPGAMVIGNQVFGITRANAGDTPYHLLVGAKDGPILQQELVVVAAEASHIELRLSSNFVEAGNPVDLQAEFQDRFGNRILSDAPVLSEDSPQDFSPAAIATNGLTTARITVTSAGDYTLSASDPSGLVSAVDASLQVVAGPPVNQNFFEIDPSGMPYAAGDPVAFSYSFVDAYGNANSSTPILVSVNAPNVVITDDGFGAGEINGLIRSGSYTVRARAVGTGLNDDLETLTIGPNPEDEGFNLILSSGLIAEGGTALFFVVDGFGNNIELVDVNVTPSDASISVSGNQLTFALPGTYSVSACLASDASICDTEFIGVQGIVDTVPPSVSVSIVVPDPNLSNEVTARGIVAYRVDASDDRGLSQIDIVASFGQESGVCTVQQGPVLLSGGTSSQSLYFSLQVPRCALPLDSVSIVARAQDEAGNSRNSAPHSELHISSPLALAAPGFIASFAAWQDRIADNPYDVAVNPLTGELYVSVRGNDRIVVVPFDRQQYDLRDNQDNRIRPQGPFGVAFDAVGNFFVHAQDAGNNDPGIDRVRPNLVFDEPFIDRGNIWSAYPNDGYGMAIDESNGLAPRLCGAIPSSNRVQCFDDFSDANANPNMLINISTATGRPRSVAFAPPSANHSEDILWVLLDNTPALRGYQFNAARDGLSFLQEIDLSTEVNPGECGDIVVAPGTDNIILSHRSDGRILRIAPTSGSISVIASGFDQPIGMAWDGASLLVVDENAGAVIRISPDPANPGIF